jgi:hypothetical protein
MAHLVDTYLKKAGCSDDHSYDTLRMVYFTCCESVVTVFLVVSTCLLIVDPTEDLSVRAYGVLCFTIETFTLFFISLRFYNQSKIRDIYQRTQGMKIPENFINQITTVIKYHLILPNLFFLVSLLYTILLDSVKIGDQFTFPFVDVLSIKTTNVAIYVCKFILYTLPVYFGLMEVSYMLVTYMYSTGVLHSHFQIFDEQVKEFMVNMDEHKLKIAIKHHQEILK